MHIRHAQGSLNNGLYYLEEHPMLMQVQSNKHKLDNQMMPIFGMLDLDKFPRIGLTRWLPLVYLK